MPFLARSYNNVNDDVSRRPARIRGTRRRQSPGGLDRKGDFCDKPAPVRHGAQVAQLVEHVTENYGVVGSIPTLGTILSRTYLKFDRTAQRACPRYVRNRNEARRFKMEAEFLVSAARDHQ